MLDDTLNPLVRAVAPLIATRLTNDTTCARFIAWYDHLTTLLSLCINNQKNVDACDLFHDEARQRGLQQQGLQLLLRYGLTGLVMEYACIFIIRHAQAVFLCRVCMCTCATPPPPKVHQHLFLGHEPPCKNCTYTKTYTRKAKTDNSKVPQGVSVTVTVCGWVPWEWLEEGR